MPVNQSNRSATAVMRELGKLLSDDSDNDINPLEFNTDHITPRFNDDTGEYDFAASENFLKIKRPEEKENQPGNDDRYNQLQAQISHLTGQLQTAVQTINNLQQNQSNQNNSNQRQQANQPDPDDDIEVFNENFQKGGKAYIDNIIQRALAKHVSPQIVGLAQALKETLGQVDFLRTGAIKNDFKSLVQRYPEMAQRMAKGGMSYDDIADTLQEIDGKISGGGQGANRQGKVINVNDFRNKADKMRPEGGNSNFQFNGFEPRNRKEALLMSMNQLANEDLASGE